jgi:hypothetical protein
VISNILNSISLEIDYPYCPDDTEQLFIADITGNDSIAALIKTNDSDSPKFVIPSIISLGCEFGDKSQPHIVINKLSSIYKGSQINLLPAITLDINLFWKLFISNNMNSSINHYKFYSPCIACHLLMPSLPH